MTVFCGDYVRTIFGYAPQKENEAYVEFSGYVRIEFKLVTKIGIFNLIRVKQFFRGWRTRLFNSKDQIPSDMYKMDIICMLM